MIHELKIPKQETLDLFILIGIKAWNFNKINLSDYDHSDTLTDRDPDWICLGKTNITIAIPQGVDVRQQMLEKLENLKKKTLAKHHKELKQVQDKIDSLMAIEYKGGEISIPQNDVNFDDEIPF